MLSFSVKARKYSLLALVTGLSAIYFTLVWLADDTGHLGMSMLFYFCVGSLVWDERDHIHLHWDWLSIVIGVLLLGWILKHSSPNTNEYWVRLFPWLGGLSVCLIASGWRHMRQYGKVLLLLFFLSVPSVFAYYWIDLAPLTARFSALLLWYAGFDVSSQGTVLGLDGGRPIEVVYDCSGIDIVLYMLGLSIACLVMFPVSGLKRLMFACMSVALGFSLNGIRVAMLAVLLGSDRTAFNQWHTGTGSYTFALIGVCILGLIYWGFLSWDSGSLVIQEATEEIIQLPELSDSKDFERNA